MFKSMSIAMLGLASTQAIKLKLDMPSLPQVFGGGEETPAENEAPQDPINWDSIAEKINKFHADRDEQAEDQESATDNRPSHDEAVTAFVDKMTNMIFDKPSSAFIYKFVDQDQKISGWELKRAYTIHGQNF